jgi:hypothetical protein
VQRTGGSRRGSQRAKGTREARAAHKGACSALAHKGPARLAHKGLGRLAHGQSGCREGPPHVDPGSARTMPRDVLRIMSNKELEAVAHRDTSMRPSEAQPSAAAEEEATADRARVMQRLCHCGHRPLRLAPCELAAVHTREGSRHGLVSQWACEQRGLVRQWACEQRGLVSKQVDL